MTPKKTNTLSLDDLDTRYNPNVIIPAKIKAALEKLGDSAMLADDFRKLAEVGIAQLAQYATQFEDFQIVVRDNAKPKTLWCGTAKFAAKAKERLNK